MSYEVHMLTLGHEKVPGPIAWPAPGRVEGPVAKIQRLTLTL
jgi:hypothetical protein